MLVEALGDGFTAGVETDGLIIESRGSLLLTYRAQSARDNEAEEQAAAPLTEAPPANPGPNGRGGPPPA